jgi:NAD(P)-dependent dehydrogenase (short-subunit alcohol dehydrogenase family)
MNDSKVIVITGGSRGIGARTALEASRCGLGVILTYNASQDAAHAVVHEIAAEGGKAVALPLDVSICSGFAAFRAEVELAMQANWRTSSLAGLVNNAGYGLFQPIAAVTEAEFDGLFNVHLKAPFFLTQSLLPLLVKGSSIVNLTSATTRVATAGVAPYAAFKGGLQVLTRYMAKEFGPLGIRVNSVSPGPIRTELGGGLNDEFEALLSSQTALARVGEAEEVARAITWLLSDAGGWINAQDIEVSGGYVI